MNKGLTIIEVVISFSIALVLIISLYVIVYWGTSFNPVNEKIMEINNVLTFIQSDMLKNVTLYFEYDQNTGNIYPRANIDDIIRDRIRNKGYQIGFVESINVTSFEKEEKPDVGKFENLYRVGIRVRWTHKNYSRNYDVEILVSSYDYKKIMSGQDPSAVSLSLNIPSTHVTSMYNTTIQKP